MLLDTCTICMSIKSTYISLLFIKLMEYAAYFVTKQGFPEEFITSKFVIDTIN